MRNIKAFLVVIVVFFQASVSQAFVSDFDIGVHGNWIWAPPSNKMIVSSVVTPIDWTFFNSANWGEPGVRYIISRCAAAGIKRVYWRVFAGPEALYNSKLDDLRVMETRLGISYREGDCLKQAVEYGHQLGLEVYAWYTCMEENHSSILEVPSEFAKRHPEFLEKDKDGNVYPSRLAWAFPEVRDYKLRVVNEILSYGVDGIMLDLVRNGVSGRSFVDSKQTFALGYVQPAIDEFSKLYGVRPDDPLHQEEWFALRASYYTKFMEEVRQEVAGTGRNVEIGILVGRAVPYKSLAFDTTNWASRGLIDWASAMGSFAFGVPPKKGEIAETAAYLRNDVLGGVPGKVVVGAHLYEGVSSVLVQNVIEDALQAGIHELVFYETNAIEYQDVWEAIASKAQPREVYFRKTIQVPIDFIKGDLFINCKDQYRFYINGVAVIEGSYDDNLRSVDVTPYLQQGKNVLAVYARTENGRGGLFVKGRVISKSGEEYLFSSSDDWLISTKAQRNWQSPGFNDRGWAQAQLVGEELGWPWIETIAPLTGIKYPIPQVINNNVASLLNDARASANSHYSKAYTAEYAIDGCSSRNDSAWYGTELPTSIEIEFSKPEQINKAVLNLGNTIWARKGIPSDFVLQYWDGSKWQDLIEPVSGNENSYLEYRFSTVTTQKIRFYVTVSNPNDFVFVREIEIYRTP